MTSETAAESQKPIRNRWGNTEGKSLLHKNLGRPMQLLHSMSMEKL